MFTHHDLMLLQITERQLETETEARRGGLVAARRRARRADRWAGPVPHQTPARAPRRTPAGARGSARAGARGEAAAPGGPAGTLAACAAGGGPAR